MGERSREGNDLWNEMHESGVIDKTALVFGQMNEAPGVRITYAFLMAFPMTVGSIFSSCTDDFEKLNTSNIQVNPRCV